MCVRNGIEIKGQCLGECWIWTASTDCLALRYYVNMIIIFYGLDYMQNCMLNRPESFYRFDYLVIKQQYSIAQLGGSPLLSRRTNALILHGIVRALCRQATIICAMAAGEWLQYHIDKPVHLTSTLRDNGNVYDMLSQLHWLQCKSFALCKLYIFWYYPRRVACWSYSQYTWWIYIDR